MVQPSSAATNALRCSPVSPRAWLSNPGVMRPGVPQTRRYDASMPATVEFDTVLVVDFGAQYAQLIARRVRECHVYSEIVPWTTPLADLVARQPKAIILSGGPASVYAADAPAVDPALFDTDVPTLGICYGHQAMA